MLRVDEAVGDLTGGWIVFARGLDVFRGLVCVSIVSGGYSAEPVIALLCGLLPICPDKAIKQAARCFSMNIHTHMCAHTQGYSSHALTCEALRSYQQDKRFPSIKSLGL